MWGVCFYRGNGCIFSGNDSNESDFVNSRFNYFNCTGFGFGILSFRQEVKGFGNKTDEFRGSYKGI